MVKVFVRYPIPIKNSTDFQKCAYVVLGKSMKSDHVTPYVTLRVVVFALRVVKWGNNSSFIGIG